MCVRIESLDEVGRHVRRRIWEVRTEEYAIRSSKVFERRNRRPRRECGVEIEMLQARQRFCWIREIGPKMRHAAGDAKCGVRHKAAGVRKDDARGRVSVDHPIEDELDRGTRRVQEKVQQRAGDAVGRWKGRLTGSDSRVDEDDGLAPAQLGPDRLEGAVTEIL